MKKIAESCIHPDYLKGPACRHSQAVHRVNQWPLSQLTQHKLQHQACIQQLSHLPNPLSFQQKRNSDFIYYASNTDNLNISCLFSFPTTPTILCCFHLLHLQLYAVYNREKSCKEKLNVYQLYHIDILITY